MIPAALLTLAPCVKPVTLCSQQRCCSCCRILMARMEEQDKPGSSTQHKESASEAMPLMSRTLTHSGSLRKVVTGYFRYRDRLEVLLVRDNSLQLCSRDFKAAGKIQPLFVTVIDVGTVSSAASRVPSATVSSFWPHYFAWPSRASRSSC